MSFDVRNISLASLNSMTKYPSIPTYHTLDVKNGNLIDGQTVDFGDHEVLMTEKVDGTNSRLIILPDGKYIIGSREELLYYAGDLIGDPAMGIVDTLRPVAERILQPGSGWWVGQHTGVVSVIYLETYGGKVSSGSKNYGREEVGLRVFDSCDFPDYEKLLTLSPEQLAAWRMAGDQKFLSWDALADRVGDVRLDLVPSLGAEKNLPTSIDHMKELVEEKLPSTQCALTPTALGVPEGIVLRTRDRSIIAKARREDYDRTIRRRDGTRRMK